MHFFSVSGLRPRAAFFRSWFTHTKQDRHKARSVKKYCLLAEFQHTNYVESFSRVSGIHDNITEIPQLRERTWSFSCIGPQCSQRSG